MFPHTMTSNAAPEELTDYHAMTMEEILRTEEPLTWVFAGDSITHNAVWSQGMNSYSEWFEQYLYEIDRRDDSVVLSAWGGADIYDFQTYENTPSGNGAKADPGMGLENMITKYDPDVVFIKLGMNDRGKTQETWESYYNLMLDGIYEKGAENGKKPKIVLLTPSPLSGETIYNTEEEDTDSVWRFQRYLTGIAAERGLLLCDLVTAFTQEAVALGSDYASTFFTDPSDGGIHPNAAGQYLIFKTLSKTLGIYDEELPLYQLEYEDFNGAALWVDATSGVTYDNGYDALTTSGDGTQVDEAAMDEEEMNKDMPSLGAQAASLLAAIDFDSDSGVFPGGNSASEGRRVSLLDEAVCEDPLTLAEVQGLANEFTVVFRAKLEANNARANQPVLFISSDGTTNWNNAIALGIPSASNQCYYEIRSGGTERTSSANTFTIGNGNPSVDGGWHTIAIVQSADSFTYYLDGEVVGTKDYRVNSGYKIGSGFSDPTNFTAYIGYYADNQPTFHLKGKLDYYQLYGSALTAQQVKELADANPVESDSSEVEWSQAVTENNVWVIAGGEQMSGYEGPVVNRSLFRHIDNTTRDSNCAASVSTNGTCRDIRMVSVAAPGRTVEELNTKYDTLIARHDHQVFLLLPEVSAVCEEDYQHSADEVAAYKEAVKSLLDKEDGKVRILWTPLASADETINGYLDDYAQAVREIVAQDGSILFFDANRFMNENMAFNESLKRNWFEEDMYLSPLGAADVAYAFQCTSKNLNTTGMELRRHNLRLSSDERVFKGEYVRDYVEAGVEVQGTVISIDTAPIIAAYPDITNIWLVLLPGAGTGNYHKELRPLDEVADVVENGTVHTFEAPCSDPVIAVYGERGGKIYRFKDLAVEVTTSAQVTEKEPEPQGACLNHLEVVGAPAIGFEENKTQYDVTLYQYQREVQILAEAEEGLTITVNGTEVASGAYSGLIPVEDMATVTVKVSGTVNGIAAERTYTLDLTRQENPDIIITEVMQDAYWGYDTEGNDNYELIEVYNASGRDLNLLDYSIGHKKDYPYTKQDVSEGNWPYYFTGNNQAFQSTSSSAATYTGINEITKYSTYWEGGSDKEPEEVLFKADSTMVIWIKFSAPSVSDKEAYGKSLTYETLIKALKAHQGTHTLSVDIDGTDTAVVPVEEQLVVAEIPMGETVGDLKGRAKNTADSSPKNFYMGNHGAYSTGATTRSWLFVLKDSAVPAENGAITEAGDDIISAARFIRLGSNDKLSSVFAYDTERGISLVKDQATWDNAAIGQGHTSDQQGYCNLTSFGAVEYWQKPYDSGDSTPAVVVNNTPAYVVSGETGMISLDITDDEDIRYLELYVRRAGETEYRKLTRDFVLEAGVKNTGVSEDITSLAYTYELGELTGTVEYYGFVRDGNQHDTWFGSETSPESIAVTKTGMGTLKLSLSVAENEEPSAPDTTLTATITLTSASGDEAAALEGTYLIVNEAQEELGVIAADSSGTYRGSLLLRHGEEAYVKDLPVGTGYLVAFTLPGGYVDKTETALSGRIQRDVTATVALSLQAQSEEPGSGEEPKDPDAGTTETPNPQPESPDPTPESAGTTPKTADFGTTLLWCITGLITGVLLVAMAVRRKKCS